ncbi:MAG: hypothetical protein AAB276_07235 [Pseudomonadota bacterium]
MMKKKSLLMLVDARSYIRDNCYQGQLAEVLRDYYDVRMITLKEMKYLPWANSKSYDKVLSVLKLRTLDDNLDVISKFLKDTPLYIYEQDVWQAYMDDSPWKGAYERILKKLNVTSFLLTTQWWTEFVTARGVPATFVKMGMLQRYCDAGPAWEDRHHGLAFQGTLHPHRKKFYDELAGYGVHVEFLTSRPYAEFLKTLHDIRIYIHTEDAPWCVDGQMIPRNALWIKDTEAAARGCFAIRDHEDEAFAYGIKDLPTIFTYRAVSEVPDIIKHIETMNPDARNALMRQSAHVMYERNDWMSVIAAMENGA